MSGPLSGMSRTEGVAMDGNAHLAQSIGDILTTPLGSRVMRRDYGSMLFDLIDQPLNAITRTLLYAATAIALRQEPRFRLEAAKLTGDFARGEAAIELTGQRTDLPTANSRTILSIPIRRGGAAILFA